ncbi:hypothetical protein [Undibacterium seohonense]|nr:hypothetical protein [Undibacterium seohonense]
MIITEKLASMPLDSPSIVNLHHLISTTIKDEQHSLVFDSNQGLECVLNGYHERVRKTVENLILASIRSSSTYTSSRSTIKVDQVENSTWDEPVPVLKLEDALNVINEKVIILLENSENDWNFLLGIMKQRDRERILKYAESGWVEPVHGGGDSLGRILESEGKKQWKALRTFVLFDSDRLHPDEFNLDWTPERVGQQPSSCHAFGWEACVKQYFRDRYWMLKRRFIESYMPRDELILAAENKTDSNAVKFFFEMDQNARWYYNMKAGLEKDRKRADSERSRDLFSGLSDEALKSLSTGFGNTIARHYKQSIGREFSWDMDARQEADIVLPKLLNLL